MTVHSSRDIGDEISVTVHSSRDNDDTGDSLRWEIVGVLSCYPSVSAAESQPKTLWHNQFRHLFGGDQSVTVIIRMLR